jgi:hypothetical protein
MIERLDAKGGEEGEDEEAVVRVGSEAGMGYCRR